MIGGEDLTGPLGEAIAAEIASIEAELPHPDLPYTMSVSKRAYNMDISQEFLAELMGFQREGYLEETPLTDEDVRAHARAKAAIEEIEENPWVEWVDEWPVLRPLEPKQTFIPTESHEAYMKRFQEWRRPASDEGDTE